MRISCNWLRDYVAIAADPERLAHRLTMAGLEVEKVERLDGDTVFELEITPNRPDCLNHIGIAREVSSILNKSLNPPKINIPKLPKKRADIKVLDNNDCSRYIGIVIENVSVKSAPGWIKERISSLGSHGINNIVDITNFCLMETGQPLHAFDYDKLIGGKIIVRRAQKGESIITIDGEKRLLDSSILVIADAKRPVAIAGIMGGQETEVSETTKNVLLESAYFDPTLIRRAGRKLGLSSDSSYRFERGVDIDTVESGSLRATSLIIKHAGGVLKAHSDIYPQKKKKTRTHITISKGEIDSLLGALIPVARSKAILTKLGFNVVSPKKGVFKIVPPSFRGDIKEKVDIIEEIVRIIGYDNLPVTLPQTKVTRISFDRNRTLREILANSLVAQGLNEVISYTMINREILKKTKQDSLNAIKVKNPLTKEQEIMRPSLLPSLLSLILTNINRAQKNIAFFETGKIYPVSGEQEALGVIMTGNLLFDWRRPAKEQINFYDLKGVLEEVFGKIGVHNLYFENYRDPIFEEGQAARIIFEKKAIGQIGQVSEDILKNWDIKQGPVFFAQIETKNPYMKATLENRYRKICEFPAIIRDISLAVKGDIAFKQVKDIIYKQECEFLTSLKFIEQYLGDKIPNGHRGMTVSLVYQSSLKTLREDEVIGIHKKICQALCDDLGAILR